MKYSTFNRKNNNQLLEPMFFGENVNVARYDENRHEIIDALAEKQHSFFWVPSEVDLSKDRIDFKHMSNDEEHVFVNNLRYQILLDSIQGRAPNTAFLPICSTSEVEAWILAWSFSESIHSRSYTHILRNVFTDPSSVFDGVVDDEEILKRAADISKYYDDLIEMSMYYQLHGEGSVEINGKEVKITLKELKKKLYLCLMSVNALEAIRFYVSFASTWAFSQSHSNPRLEGSSKIMKLISRDEALHLTGTQHMLNLLRNGMDDFEFIMIAEECKDECIEIFRAVAEQEKSWAKYLYGDKTIVNLNYKILCKYIDFMTNIRMKAVGLPSIFPDANENPISWIDSWLNSDNVQEASQEVERSSYLVGGIDSECDRRAFKGFKL